MSCFKQVLGDIEDKEIRVRYYPVLLKRKKDPGDKKGPGLKSVYDALSVYLEVLNEQPPGPGNYPTVVELNWIKYSNHFEPLINNLPFVGRGDWEQSIDLRAFKPKNTKRFLKTSFRKELEESFRNGNQTKSLDGEDVIIGDFTSWSENLVRHFNHQFWGHVFPYMKAMGKTNDKEEPYDKVVGDSPDHGPELIRRNALAFLLTLEKIWSRLGPVSDEQKAMALPLVHAELGTASAAYAKKFIEQLYKLDKTRSNILEDVKWVYFFGDSSQMIIDQIDEMNIDHTGLELDSDEMDVEYPGKTFEPYYGRLLNFHGTNLFDNLPYDELYKVDGEFYQVESRLYLPRKKLTELCEKFKLSPTELRADLKALHNKEDVENFLNKYENKLEEKTFYLFWDLLFQSFKRERRFKLIPEITKYDFWDDDDWDDEAKFSELFEEGESPGKILKELLKDVETIRFNLSNHVIKSVIKLIGLLHSEGYLEITDILVNDMREFLDDPDKAFPSKYRGSLAGWVDISLIQEIVKSHMPIFEFERQSLPASSKKRKMSQWRVFYKSSEVPVTLDQVRKEEVEIAA